MAAEKPQTHTISFLILRWFQFDFKIQGGLQVKNAPFSAKNHLLSSRFNPYNPFLDYLEQNAIFSKVVFSLKLSIYFNVKTTLKKFKRLLFCVKKRQNLKKKFIFYK